MTEQAPQGSIVANEYANAEHQATLAAAAALEHAGVVGATTETVDALTKEIPSLASARGLYTVYMSKIGEILDDPDMTDEERQDAYADLKLTVDRQFSELAPQMQAEIEAKRTSINRYLFGSPDSNSGVVDATARHVAAMNYRDAMSRLQGASTQELKQQAELASYVGDDTMSRAAAAAADMRLATAPLDERAELEAIVGGYVYASEQRVQQYATRQTLPTTQTIATLAGAYQPPALLKSQIKPSPYAQKKAKERSANKARKRDRVFQGRL